MSPRPPRRHLVRISSEEEARRDATEVVVFIRDAGLTDEEMVDFLTVVLMGAAGRLEAEEVVSRAADIAAVAMRRKPRG